MKKPLIIYHKNCDDGFGAAWAAWKKLGDTADYLPMDYKTPLAEADVEGRDVTVIDFSFAPDVVYADILPRAKSLTVLDHHLSAMQTWRRHLGVAGDDAVLRHDEDRYHLFFDMDKSGAWLAWEHFHPGTPVPRMIRHISDGDLWRFAEEGTRDLYSVLRARKRDFASWDALNDRMVKDAQAVLATGAEITAFYEQQLQQVLAAGRETAIEMTGIVDGKPVTARGLCLNTTKLFASEIGNALAAKSGTFAVVWETDGETAFCSMRSVAGFDSIPYAEAQGGGGHAQACGFSVPLARMIAALDGKTPL